MTLRKTRLSQDHDLVFAFDGAIGGFVLRRLRYARSGTPGKSDGGSASKDTRVLEEFELGTVHSVAIPRQCPVPLIHRLKNCMG